MSDLSDLYRAWNEDKKRRRRERYESANPEGWEQHNANHWHRTIDGKKLNYWPSTGLVMIGRKRHNINSKRIQSLLARSEGVHGASPQSDYRPSCYGCGEKADWLAPDGRCGDCTRLTPEEVAGDER